MIKLKHPINKFERLKILEKKTNKKIKSEDRAVRRLAREIIKTKEADDELRQSQVS